MKLKRSLSLLAAMGIFAAVLTGCTSSEDSAPGSNLSSAPASSDEILSDGSELILSQSGEESSSRLTSSSVEEESSSRQTSSHDSSKTPSSTGAASQGGQTSSTPTRKTVRVTIPEGFTFLQIAQRLEANGVCSAKEFYETAQSYQPSTVSVPNNSNRAYKMEGYLYPETYEFYQNDDPKSVLIKMLNTFKSRVGAITEEQLILASIIEKESRSVKNAQLVASVLYNRLSKGMKLEADATREYVNLRITNSPLLTNTAKYAALYNTYKCSALPAGPICCPGARAIQAAKQPAKSDYLYFFYGNDNENHYSKTYEEHQAQMEKYGVQYGN